MWPSRTVLVEKKDILNDDWRQVRCCSEILDKIIHNIDVLKQINVHWPHDSVYINNVKTEFVLSMRFKI